MTGVKADLTFAVMSSTPAGEHDAMAVRLNKQAFEHAKRCVIGICTE
jgi:hypothetical protein